MKILLLLSLFYVVSSYGDPNVDQETNLTDGSTETVDVIAIQRGSPNLIDMLESMSREGVKRRYENMIPVLSKPERQDLSFEQYEKNAKLMTAINSGDFNTAIALLDQGADKNARNTNGETLPMLLDARLKYGENVAAMSREEKKNIRKLRRMLTTNQSFLSKCSSSFASFVSFLSR